MSQIKKMLRELLPIDSDLEIDSIYTDSREVRKNSIFFCIDGMTVDGHEFVSQAIRNGAKVIVHSKDLEYYDPNVIYHRVEDTSSLVVHVANLFYNHPSQKLKVCGITGTVGKSTVASLVYQASKNLLKMGYIGTHLVEYGDHSTKYQYTTPEHLFLQESLYNMVEANMDSVCIEVSSHGLSLKRVAGIDFDIAVFTNLFPDHLDFHQTMENYENSKLSLFTGLKESAWAILDQSEPFTQTIKQYTKAQIFEYGVNVEADLSAKNVQLFYDHSEFDLIYESNSYHLSLPIIGRANINHVLASIAVLLKYDINIDKVIEAFNNIVQNEGHYERVPNDHNINIIIDESYTPSHYQELFEFVKSIKTGRIIAVFGCVGKKEYSKREKIGKLADKYIDYAILTEENSRQEDTEDICKAIQKGIKNIPSVIIENRELAIYQAIESANSGDTVLVIGKGNDCIITRDEPEYYIGDKVAIQKALKEIYDSSSEDDYDDDYEDFI